MSKTLILRIMLLVVILAGIGGIFLGLQKRQKLTDAEKAKTEAEQKASDASSKLSGAESKAKKATDDLQTVQAALDTSKKEAEENKKKAEANLAELKRTEEELAKTASDAKAASLKLEQLNKVLPPGVDPSKILDEMKRVQSDLQVLNDEKSLLSTKLAELESENTNMKKRLQNRVAGEIPKDLVGHVMAVNAEWNFVVLDVGENDGMVANKSMLIYRDGQLIGRVKVTSVEPSISIGDILPKWTNGELREGDSAIAAESAS
jgi:cell shape-determining protein MreC